jgi:hypothetical protein
MNIEQIKEAVEAVLERQIDPTVWDRFVRSDAWHHPVIELLAGLFLDAERYIMATLAELDAAEQGVEQ